MNCRFVEWQITGCKVTWFTKKDFCLITGLCYYESYDLEVEPFNIRPLTKYFPQKFGFIEDSSKGMKGKGKVKTTPKKATKKVTVTCAELERAFKESEDEDDALKIGRVYFTNGVLIRAKSNVVMNLKYLDLIGSTLIHGVRYRPNNYGTTFVLLLLGEEDEERMIVPIEAKRNSGYWTWGDDTDVVMLETLTPDTKDVGELKVQIKELMVAVFSEESVEEGGRVDRGGEGIEEGS
ncbi:hypothetical protein DVH24_006948 [Malus domestica]|uniref:Uncharacterized protein n=1 Tax=Malus domestica TaxID=3750 RepID=A0A498I567_MALDO|nr:hypothetical protein DVH24_006948 [Malus domestica]